MIALSMTSKKNHQLVVRSSPYKRTSCQAPTIIALRQDTSYSRVRVAPSPVAVGVSPSDRREFSGARLSLRSLHLHHKNNLIKESSQDHKPF